MGASCIYLDSIWLYLCRFSSWFPFRNDVFKKRWSICFWNSWRKFRINCKTNNESFLCCTFTISWSCIYNESCSNPKRYNRNKLWSLVGSYHNILSLCNSFTNWCNYWENLSYIWIITFNNGSRNWWRINYYKCKYSWNSFCKYESNRKISFSLSMYNNSLWSNQWFPCYSISYDG